MRSVSYLKVKDHENLVRDPNTKAILSVNENEYSAFKAKRDAELKRQQLIDQQIQEIECIKSDMIEIKQMLNLLIKGK